MPPENILPTWAPRVPQAVIRRLYETDAQGRYDDELIDEVGWAIYARCASFVEAVEATRGRAKCPQCGAIVRHQAGYGEVLHCACGWELPWYAYFRTIQHRQLSGAERVLDIFRQFMAGWGEAQTPQQKMIFIDQVIHAFHADLKGDPTRTTGVNLIEGNYHEVVDFLDELTYGPASTPGAQERWRAWHDQIDETAQRWQDRRLRRTR